MILKEDDLVLCTVKSIEGTTVFLDIEGDGTGSLVLSEIAAGRIRNIRDYVVPNKKVVCKILKIINGHPQLSLRRVTAKEKSAVLEKSQKEKTAHAIIKTVSKGYETVVKKIKEEYEDLSDFIDKAREDLKIINKFFSKEEVPLLLKILTEKKEKEKEAKKIIMLRTNSPSGIQEMQEALSLSEKNIEIRYLGSSHFSLSAKGKDFKDANSKIDIAIAKIKEKAHQKKITFELQEK